METVADQMAILEDIGRRARARPRTFDELVGLERELSAYIGSLRGERERIRAEGLVEAETPELRKAMHTARIAIKHALTEHETAGLGISRLEEMVRKGHVHEAVKEHAQLQTPTLFPDLNCDFIGTAVTKHQARERRLVTSVLVAAGIILALAAFIEILNRPTPK